jgi:hypothetical protein
MDPYRIQRSKINVNPAIGINNTALFSTKINSANDYLFTFTLEVIPIFAVATLKHGTVVLI